MVLDASGNLTAAAFLYSSDRRLKENIKAFSGGLAKLDTVEPVTFRYISDTTHRERLGLIAQEVETAFPQAVVTDKDTGMKSVDYPALVPVLIGAVKELKAANDEQRAEGEKLREIVNSYRALQKTQMTENGLMREQLIELRAANDNLARRLKTLEARKAASE
jgi:hypothetical protein